MLAQGGKPLSYFEPDLPGPSFDEVWLLWVCALLSIVVMGSIGRSIAIRLGGPRFGNLTNVVHFGEVNALLALSLLFFHLAIDVRRFYFRILMGDMPAHPEIEASFWVGCSTILFWIASTIVAITALMVLHRGANAIR